VFAIARFEVPAEEQATFVGDLERAHQALAACEGYLSGQIGLNTDEPTLIALVKINAVPILARAIDEPGGYLESDE
jgi:hypothetical protein